MAIVKRAFVDMRDAAKQHQIRFVVTLVPTKEQVYGRILREAGFLDKHLQLVEALEQEEHVRSEIIEFLRTNGMELIDLLPALKSGTSQQELYPLADGHPNKNGYRAIASAINLYLNGKH